MGRYGWPALLAGWLFTWSAAALVAPNRVNSPLVCNKGPEGERYQVVVSAPSTVPEGGTFTVRIESMPSIKVTGVGLNYLHDGVTEYLVPQGGTYVPGSARVIPGTGTVNVRPGAAATNTGSIVRLTLPARIAKDTTYTAPTLEFQVRVTAPAGTALAAGFWQLRIKANAFVVGDVSVVCNPTQRPLSLSATTVTARL